MMPRDTIATIGVHPRDPFATIMTGGVVDLPLRMEMPKREHPFFQYWDF